MSASAGCGRVLAGRQARPGMTYARPWTLGHGRWRSTRVSAEALQQHQAERDLVRRR
jgi:hypothetical protein